ncbi:MAG: TRAP transporter small permease [Burkholderiales bacterium]|nr:TRAP transporter small permease [Burkholderiales bacterium]
MGALFLQVVSRYFGWQVDWTEELARFSFIVMVFASASYASSRGSHLSVTIFSDMAKRWTYSKWLVEKLQLLAVFVFDCLFCWYAAANVIEGFRWPNLSPSLGFNENLLFLAPAVGFAAAIIQRVLALFDDRLPESRLVLP